MVNKKESDARCQFNHSTIEIISTTCISHPSVPTELLVVTAFPLGPFFSPPPSPPAPPLRPLATKQNCGRWSTTASRSRLAACARRAQTLTKLTQVVQLSRGRAADAVGRLADAGASKTVRLRRRARGFATGAKTASGATTAGTAAVVAAAGATGLSRRVASAREKEAAGGQVHARKGGRAQTATAAHRTTELHCCRVVHYCTPKPKACCSRGRWRPSRQFRRLTLK